MTRAPDRPADGPPTGMNPPPRIVQVRGASGSGKTTLARMLMAGLRPIGKWYEKGRKAPICLTFEKPGRPLCVIGNYGEATTGGCDTIAEKETVHRIAREAARQGFDVFMEGILLSLEFWRTLYLHEDGFDRYDVFIDLSVEECTEWVHRRQEAAGKARQPLKQMAAFHPRVMHTRERLLVAGVPGETMPAWVSIQGNVEGARLRALENVKELLGCD